MANKRNGMVLHFDSVDVNKITFSDPKLNDKGGMTIFVRYNDAPLIIQGPEMIANWGLSRLMDKKTGDEDLSIPLTFRNQEIDENVKRFRVFFDKLYDRIFEATVNNAASWLNNPDHDRNSLRISKVVKSAIKQDKEAKYAEYIRFKVYTNKTRDGQDNLSLDIFDADSSSRVAVKTIEEQEDLLQKECRMTPLFKLGTLWVIDGKIGPTMRLIQGRVKRPQDSIQGYGFIDTEDVNPAEANDGGDAMATTYDYGNKENMNINAKDHFENHHDTEDY